MDFSRYQLIERVLSYDDAPPRIECASLAPAQAPVFEGHFPGYPILPATWQTEMMAQAAGLLLLRLTRCEKAVFLTGVDAARFRAPLRPPCALRARAELVDHNGALAMCRCGLGGEGKIAAQAELRLALAPPPNAALAAHLRALAEETGLWRAGAVCA